MSQRQPMSERRDCLNVQYETGHDVPTRQESHASSSLEQHVCVYMNMFYYVVRYCEMCFEILKVLLVQTEH